MFALDIETGPLCWECEAPGLLAGHALVLADDTTVPETLED
jgi:hypothetical protein